MTGEQSHDLVAAYRLARDRVIDRAVVWRGWSGPRRACRMTREEADLFDAVSELVAACRALRDT